VLCTVCCLLQVDLWLGDAISKLPQVSSAKGGRQIDLLLCAVCCLLQVDLWLGDAISKLPQVSSAKGGRQIDLLLLDGLPKETLQYLRAAEPYLAPGAMVVADNAGRC
jgi:hypothetical protein